MPHDTKHFDIISISDTHLGRDTVKSEWLVDFLNHTECKQLILNGDIIEGWAVGVLDEMQLRVLDGINRKVAEGTKVTYIPGNHDEKLRSIPGLMGATVFGIDFRPSLNFRDKAGRRVRFSHGDEYDGLVQKVGKQIHDIGHRLRMVSLYDRFHYLKGKLEKKHRKELDKAGDYSRLILRMGGWATGFIPAVRAARLVGKEVVKQLRPEPYSLSREIKRERKMYEDSPSEHRMDHAIAKDTRLKSCDMYFAGHSHVPGMKVLGGVCYGNSGSFVEGTTATVCSDLGVWGVIDAEQLRQDFWPDDPMPDSRSSYTPQSDPSAIYRPVTLRQVRMVQRVFGQKQRAKTLRKIAREGRKMRSLREQVDRVGKILNGDVIPLTPDVIEQLKQDRSHHSRKLIKHVRKIRKSLSSDSMPGSERGMEHNQKTRNPELPTGESKIDRRLRKVTRHSQAIQDINTGLEGVQEGLRKAFQKRSERLDRKREASEERYTAAWGTLRSPRLPPDASLS